MKKVRRPRNIWMGCSYFIILIAVLAFLGWLPTKSEPVQLLATAILSYFVYVGFYGALLHYAPSLLTKVLKTTPTSFPPAEFHQICDSVRYERVKSLRFPLGCRLRSQSGWVILRLTLGSDGAFSDSELIAESPSKVFRREAEFCASQSSFINADGTRPTEVACLYIFPVVHHANGWEDWAKLQWASVIPASTLNAPPGKRAK